MKMTNKLLLASLFLLAVLNAAQAEEAFRGFSEQTKPFLKKYCLECHAADVAEGGVILDDLDRVDKNNAALWVRIWEQTALKQMPPTKSSQPEALERHHFNQSITTTLEEVMTPHGGFDAHFRADKANPDEFGRVMLQGKELLLAINSAFSFIAPDDMLRQSLKDGKLKTREDVEREVTRLLNDDQFQKPKILQFFREYFDYDHAFDVLKDVKSLIEAGETVDHEQQLVFKQAMVTTVHNTDRLIELVLSEDEQVLRELLTTRRAYISARDWKYWSVIDDEARRNEEHWSGQFKYGVPKNKLHTEGIPVFRYSVVPPNSNFLNHLNIENEAADKLRDDMLVEGQLVTMPPWLRKGILTHPSWLVSHSNAMDNHVIHRGIWIRERLLGSGIPDVPITVDAMLPDEPGETLRHRMRVTKENECWRCHQRIDPLGFAFEAFTHAGRMRRDENDKELDQSGEIIDSGVPGLDGPVAGFDLIDKLADHPRSEQVFVRYAFRYWMGRNETLDDAPVIQAAYKAYRDNNGSMKALLVSLLTSDAFLYRKRR